MQAKQSGQNIVTESSEVAFIISGLNQKLQGCVNLSSLIFPPQAVLFVLSYVMMVQPNNNTCSMMFARHS